MPVDETETTIVKPRVDYLPEVQEAAVLEPAEAVEPDARSMQERGFVERDHAWHRVSF